MNNIIEKLGITEIECWIEKIDHDVNHCVEDMQKVKELEQQRDEMLEWLITDLIVQDALDFEQPSNRDQRIEKKYGKKVSDWLVTMRKSQIDTIEKATGLSWKEIKELIDE